MMEEAAATAPGEAPVLLPLYGGAATEVTHPPVAPGRRMRLRRDVRLRIATLLTQRSTACARSSLSTVRGASSVMPMLPTRYSATLNWPRPSTQRLAGRYLEPRSDEDLLRVIRPCTAVQTRYRLTRRSDGRVIVWRAHRARDRRASRHPPSGLVFETAEGA